MDTISHLLNFRIALTLNWVQVDEELIRRGFLQNGISLALDGSSSQDHLYSLSDDLVRQHLQGILNTTGRGGIAKTCTPRGLLCYVSTLEPACSTAWPRATMKPLYRPTGLAAGAILSSLAILSRAPDRALIFQLV